LLEFLGWLSLEFGVDETHSYKGELFLSRLIFLSIDLAQNHHLTILQNIN